MERTVIKNELRTPVMVGALYPSGQGEIFPVCSGESVTVLMWWHWLKFSSVQPEFLISVAQDYEGREATVTFLEKGAG